jgi:type IV pilus assembly protein PilO
VNVDLNKLKELWKDAESRKYLIGGVILAVCLLYLFIIILPGLTRMAGLSSDSRKVQRKLDKAEAKVSRIGKWKAELDVLETEHDLVASQFTAEREIAALLEEFSAIAGRSNVKILSITPLGMNDDEVTDVKQYYSSMPIMITAKSGYHQLGDFISNLENGERIINVKDLQVKFDASSPRMHQIVLRLNTYIAVDNEEKK